MGGKINKLLVNVSTSFSIQCEEDTEQSSTENGVEGLASVANNANSIKAAWEWRLDKEVTT